MEKFILSSIRFIALTVYYTSIATATLAVTLYVSSIIASMFGVIFGAFALAVSLFLLKMLIFDISDHRFDYLSEKQS